jgi:phenylacetate-CoA ligase
MNYLLNPIFISKVLKSYFFDINRLRRLSDKQIRIFQNEQLKKMIKFAYTVPYYHNIYKKAGIDPDYFKGLMDIHKLPMVSKRDLITHYPDEIVSSRMDKNKLIEVSTSGTTGKPLTIYVDLFEIVLCLFTYIRFLNEHSLNWRKDRLSIIADFAPHTVESGYIYKGLDSKFSPNILFKNIQWLNTNDSPEQVIEEINKFKPDFIGGYTGMLGHLALLKEKGLGPDIAPRVIASTGAPLSQTLKDLIEQTFNVPSYETYASTESGLIAFQCKYGGYHVMSDFVYLEYLKHGEPIREGEVGKLVLTKLFGTGTPIIRYDAINDIVEPIDDTCDCGLSGVTIKKIYGRDDIAIYTSEGKVLLPSSFGEIFSKVLYVLKTSKLKDAKVIQHSLEKIEIQVVIDEKLRTVGPSVDNIFSLLKSEFQEKVGADVEISVKEIEKLEKKESRIVSNVDINKIKITEYI